MAYESIRGLLAREAAGGRATVRGWLRTVRHAKGVSFLDVSDGSCLSGIQVVASPRPKATSRSFAHLTTGSAIAAEGTLVESPGKGQRFELHAAKVELVGAAGPDYPLQKKRHSFEFLRTIAHLRPRTNTLGAVLRIRNAASMAIHEFFQQRGLLLSPLADRDRLRRRGRRRDVPRDDAAPRLRRREGPTARSTMAPTSSAARPFSRSRASSKRRSARSRSPASTPSARPSAPRTRTPPATSPSSGWSSPRSRSAT